MKLFSKKILISSLFLAILFAGFSFSFFPKITHVYGETIPSNDGSTYNTGTGASTPPTTTTEDKTKVSKTCFNSWGIPTNITECTKDVFSAVVYIVLIVLSGILAIAGYLLDASIQYTIVKMSANISQIQSINIAWQALRDFANMLFIFVLLYVAIRTILQVGEVNAKRTLVQIIISAILINFSIFFTKALIDLSNILTLGFFNAVSANLKGSSLSNGLMSIFNLGSIFGGNGNISLNNTATLDTITKWSSQGWAVLAGMSIGSIVLIFTVAFSFLVVAFMLIFRYFVLIFLIILSPLAFAAYVLPQTKDKASKWWDALLGQAIFPVLYMMLMYVSVIILKGSFKTGALGAALQAGTVASTNTAQTDKAMDIIISFSIAIMFINAALIVAKTYASKAGSFATGALNYGIGKINAVQNKTRQIGMAATVGVAASAAAGTARIAGRGVTGTAGLAVRGTIGRGANYASESLGKSAFGQSRFGRTINQATVGAVAKQKFGLKKSSADIEKENKKAQEEFTKNTEKVIDKAVDKKTSHEALGVIRLKENKEKTDATETELKDAVIKLAETRNSLRTAEPEDIAGINEAINKQQKFVNEKQNAFNELKKKETEIKDEKDRIATTEERNKLLNAERKRVAEELENQVKNKNVLLSKISWLVSGDGSSASDVREAAAKKIRSKLKGNKSKAEELLEELTGGAKEGGEKKGEKKEEKKP